MSRLTALSRFSTSFSIELSHLINGTCCSHGAVRRFACMCAGRGHDAPQGRGYSWAADTAATTAAMLGVVAAMVTGQG